MPEAPDAALVERFHQALVSNDATALSELLADDVEWHMSGRSRFAGGHKGREAVIGFVREMHELTGGTFRPLRPDSHDVCSSGYHTVLMDRFLASRDGKELDTHVAFVVVAEAGKVTLLLPYFYDQYAWDEFWS